MRGRQGTPIASIRASKDAACLLVQNGPGLLMFFLCHLEPRVKGPRRIAPPGEGMSELVEAPRVLQDAHLRRSRVKTHRWRDVRPAHWAVCAHNAHGWQRRGRRKDRSVAGRRVLNTSAVFDAAQPRSGARSQRTSFSSHHGGSPSSRGKPARARHVSPHAGCLCSTNVRLCPEPPRVSGTSCTPVRQVWRGAGGSG